MFDLTQNPGLLVHFASFFFIAGFLVRNQLILRIMLLIGTASYILYYAIAPGGPLWEAILASVLQGLANGVVILMILLDRTTFRLDDEERNMFQRIGTLSPGEFRQLLRRGEWVAGDGATPITEEGKEVRHLYYVLVGDSTVRKGEKRFTIPSGNFVGEVAYTLGTPASATVVPAEGARYMRWAHADMNRLERKAPAIRMALQRVLNRDMAAKVASS